MTIAIRVEEKIAKMIVALMWMMVGLVVAVTAAAGDGLLVELLCTVDHFVRQRQPLCGVRAVVQLCGLVLMWMMAVLKVMVADEAEGVQTRLVICAVVEEVVAVYAG